MVALFYSQKEKFCNPKVGDSSFLIILKMGERGFRKKTDVNIEGWEESDFPILCETCLGDNPYVRMMKMKYGAACHVCSRPYTVFRWKAGQESRYKNTVICQQCSKEKNVCQCCILDLIYGLPVQVRDSFVTKTVDTNSLTAKNSIHGLNDDLLKIARVQPYYKRNLPKLCSFYAHGGCSRGKECPYRHEIQESSTNIPDQKYENRYSGVNDPVANKILRGLNDDSKKEGVKSSGEANKT